MNKFECITLLHLDSSDYIGEKLSAKAEHELSIADIVIKDGVIVKSRTKEVELSPKNFKGLTLEPETAFRQISAIIEVGMIISVIDMNEESDLSDCVFNLAKQYAEAAHDYAMGNRK